MVHISQPWFCHILTFIKAYVGLQCSSIFMLDSNIHKGLLSNGDVHWSLCRIAMYVDSEMQHKFLNVECCHSLRVLSHCDIHQELCRIVTFINDYVTFRWCLLNMTLMKVFIMYWHKFIKTCFIKVNHGWLNWSMVS